MVPASPFDQAELAPLRVMHLDCYGRARGAHTRIDHLLPGTTAAMRIPSVRANPGLRFLDCRSGQSSEQRRGDG